MGVYAAKQDLIDRFDEQALIQATDRADPPAGVIDDVVLNGAITDAEAEINGFLAARYALPLAAIPVVLKRWTCDIAYYFLLRDNAGENVTKRYESIVKSLRLVNAGELTLGSDATSAEVPAEGGVQIKGSDRVFDDDTLADY